MGEVQWRYLNSFCFFLGAKPLTFISYREPAWVKSDTAWHVADVETPNLPYRENHSRPQHQMLKTFPDKESYRFRFWHPSNNVIAV